VDVVHVVPKNPTEPPVFVEPGYLSRGGDYERIIKSLYDKHHEVVSIDHGGTHGVLELTPRQEQLLEKYFDPRREIPIRKAITMLKVLEHEGITEVNVVAHSAGAVDAAIAALIQPEHIKIRNIIFFCPAGLIDKDNGRLLRGLQGHVGMSDTQWMERASRSPLKALQEGLGLLGVDIHSLLRQLHESGVGMFVISGDDDPLFPADLMERFLDDDIEKDLIKFVRFKGGHGDMELVSHEINRILMKIKNKETQPIQAMVA
jgi:pimeloyl-ACP methyl ester carboxylesterase